MRSHIITLTTDFGLQDPYVGVMKGVILGIDPGARIVDATHAVPPGSIREAADILEDTVPFFPEGTVHVAVVDPGVGSTRRAIIAAAGGHFFVGPDNGIFWPRIRQDPESRVFHLTREEFFRKPVSRTFHGRDVFAPAAAHLAAGRDPRDMGTPVSDPVELPLKGPVALGDEVVGEVTRVDRFGNLITNIREDMPGGPWKRGACLIRAGGLEIRGIRSTYTEVPEGGVLALWGSGGRLEISVNRGRASDLVVGDSGAVGTVVRLSRLF